MLKYIVPDKLIIKRQANKQKKNAAKMDIENENLHSYGS